MPERVVSLAPSATATLRALDADDRLVGVTAHGDGPADATVLGGWLSPDLDAVEDLDPDLVLTADPLQAEVHDRLVDRGLGTCHVEPRTLEGALESMETVGTAAGLADEAAAFADRCRERVAAVSDAVAGRGRPVVYCEEWQDPPMAAGNWVPDAVRAAGGRYPFVDAGERSREVERETVEAAGPEHVVVHVCGRGDDVDPDSIARRGWDLPALAEDRVHVVGDDLFNQPGPGLVDGVEWLAGRLHPEAV